MSSPPPSPPPSPRRGEGVSNDMFNFLHTFTPQPILLQLGWLKIYWYGIFVVLGVVVGLVVVLKIAQRLGISSDEVYNLGFYLIIFGIIGGRIYAVILDLPFYLKNPWEIIAVWHGGLAIHGVIIGGLITLLIYNIPLTLALSPKGRGRLRNFWQWADILAPAIALGQAIGRWGNYFNQEIFGKPTDLPWGIPIAFQNRPFEYLSSQYFQPTFLYESLLNGFNFLILILIFRFFRHPEPAYRQGRLDSGSHESETLKQVQSDKVGFIFLIYLINYSIIRIAMEFLRLDTTPVIWGIRLPILVSGVVIVLSLGAITRLTLKKQ